MIDTLKTLIAQLILMLASSAPALALLGVIALCITVLVMKKMELEAAAEALRYATPPLRLRPCKRSQNKDTQV
jgi:hypothetical protein